LNRKITLGLKKKREVIGKRDNWKEFKKILRERVGDQDRLPQLDQLRKVRKSHTKGEIKKRMDKRDEKQGGPRWSIHWAGDKNLENST